MSSLITISAPRGICGAAVLVNFVVLFVAVDVADDKAGGAISLVGDACGSKEILVVSFHICSFLVALPSSVQVGRFL